MTRSEKWLLAALCMSFATAPAAASSRSRVEDSIVRIINSAQNGNWFSPWNASPVVESSGSGFVIEGDLIMTNAHVVSNSRLLLVQPHGDPEPHVAEVVHVAHDSDLALIRPLDPTVLDGIAPLRWRETLDLGSTVDTLGFPAGGLQLSSTRGVVSRIEDQLYMHSGKDLHLTVQTDAAINPGNSGGPVVQNGRVVGVAFQASLDLENVGYFIPMEVTQRFLHDIEDGRYDGYPELGVTTSTLTSAAARGHAGMDDGETGVRIDSVFGGASARGHLQPEDVLLSIAGREVANDGSVADGAGRIPFGLLVDRRQVGETINIRVLRAGKRLDLEPVPLRGLSGSENQGHIYDRRPRYYVYAGLVFVTLNLEMMKTYGDEWRAEAAKALLHEFLVKPALDDDHFTRERVVLLRRLDHPVNVDMAWFRNQVVERVNGREITSLEVLVEALEQHEGDYQVIEFAHYRRLGVVDRRRAEQAHEEILSRYGIQEDRHL